MSTLISVHRSSSSTGTASVGPEGPEGPVGPKGAQGDPPEPSIPLYPVGPQTLKAAQYTIFGRVNSNGSVHGTVDFASSKPVATNGIYNVTWQPHIFVDGSPIVTVTPLVRSLDISIASTLGAPIAVLLDDVSGTQCTIGMFDRLSGDLMDAGFMFTATGALA